MEEKMGDETETRGLQGLMFRVWDIIKNQTRKQLETLFI